MYEIAEGVDVVLPSDKRKENISLVFGKEEEEIAVIEIPALAQILAILKMFLQAKVKMTYRKNLATLQVPAVITFWTEKVAKEIYLHIQIEEYADTIQVSKKTHATLDRIEAQTLLEILQRYL